MGFCCVGEGADHVRKSACWMLEAAGSMSIPILSMCEERALKNAPAPADGSIHLYLGESGYFWMIVLTQEMAIEGAV